ncbi:uncharacterized protein N7459_009818 [Penicillium hispanicum]|uniref:uncharacterized protein n=1 Tax=Penicillium hispanicum TaxID=1080232 RepID=UPI0025424CCB|nr:uncharacterized protein N7459_009818 [Penicillium hispanicum]KAJ5570388.1 hypothetical protein N7459_009818 [Penicillium hispanicum]
MSAAKASTVPVAETTASGASSSADPTTSTESTESSTSASPTPTSTIPTSTSTSSTSDSTTSTISSSSSESTASSITSQGATTVIVTSTDTAGQPTTEASTIDPSSSATGSAALSTSTAAASGGGLSASGTIAVAVVVPVVSVALIILAALFFWRKRKANKAAEEERRKEVEEYGFNPNNDPTLPGMGGVAPKDDTSSGYRGWGTTSAGRKASTNLSSGMGLAVSEAGSGPGYQHAATPSEGTVQYSDGARPDSGEIEPIGVLGAAPVAANNRNGDIHRGPSNASSAYSAANHSEASEESHMSAGHPSGGYYGDNQYYGEMNTHGAYGEDAYQPVIRDVQARRNTRIENPGVFPRQGNAGIAQNF